MTSLQVARATCHSGYWHDSVLVPYTVEGMGVGEVGGAPTPLGFRTLKRV